MEIEKSKALFVSVVLLTTFGCTNKTKEDLVKVTQQIPKESTDMNKIHKDDYFGNVNRIGPDDEYARWEVEAFVYNGRPISVSFVLLSHKLEDVLELGKNYLQAHEFVDEKYARIAAEQLEESYIEDWSGNPSNAKDHLTEVFQLTGISFHGDGEVEIFLSDGGAFDGHFISIRLNKEGSIFALNLTG